MGGAVVVEPARGPMPVSPAEARSARLVGRKPTSYLAELGSPSSFECTTPHRTTPDTQPPGLTQFRSSLSARAACGMRLLSIAVVHLRPARLRHLRPVDSFPR